jgi:pimeloyl-ACP methyl ester carboxylesterase
MQREDVSFDSSGEKIAAWLYRPDAQGPRPIVVMAHGFSATRELRLPAFAERFCAAGFGVLLFDYRYFGASGGEPRQVLDIGAQQADYHAAIDYARKLPWAAPQRIALFGSSFSGGHVIAVAAQDGNIAAVVSQCPFQDGVATLPLLGVRNVLKLTVHGLRDQIGALFGLAPHVVPAVGPPGSVAVMTTEDAEPGFRAMVPAAGSLWQNKVSARIALRVGMYRPGRQAGKLRCPVLYSVCDADVVCPPQATLDCAKLAKRGEIKRYPIGHFDLYLGDWFERVVTDQAEFLQRHLLS